MENAYPADMTSCADAWSAGLRSHDLAYGVVDGGWRSESWSGERRTGNRISF